MQMQSPVVTAVFIAVMTTAACKTTTLALGPTTTPNGVRFRFTDCNARRVALAGTFNQWSTTSTPLSIESGCGIWSVVVPLPPGEHLFMFVIDGTQWITPPLADDFVDDGFGAKNGVVIVRGTERPASPKPEGEGG